MLVDEANYAPSILSQNGCGLKTLVRVSMWHACTGDKKVLGEGWTCH